MSHPANVIEIDHLVRRYGSTEAVNDMNLRVRRGTCYGFFGRNGAGKTTTIKCLLNLLRPSAGQVRVFGLDPHRDEVAVKARLAYVPDQVAFYPWMTVRDTLAYIASFRTRWNPSLEGQLIARFGLDPDQRAVTMSKGQKTQLALIGAVCCEPDLLLLDEPTSGLDPIVRREFIRTVIGAYQESAPGERTIFVSTHLISEFEGLIDEFTIVDHGRAVYSSSADEARARHVRIRARFPGEAPMIDVGTARNLRRSGRELDLVVTGAVEPVLDRIRKSGAESVETEALSLEEIFVATLKTNTSTNANADADVREEETSHVATN